MQAFTSFVSSQPSNVPFVFAYKGKYIVQVEKSTEGSPHVNAYYYVDNSQNLVDHDFEAGVPAAGQLTIENTTHVTPGSSAAFADELRDFLRSLGLANIDLRAGRAFNWYDAIAAYLEGQPEIQPITVVDNSGNSVTIVNIGEPITNSDDEDCLTVVDELGTQYLVQIWGHDNLVRIDGGFTDIMPVEYQEGAPYIFTSSINTNDTPPADNWKLLKWLVDNGLWECHVEELYTGDGMEHNINGNSCSAGENSVKLVLLTDSNTYGLFSDEGWTAGVSAYINCAGTDWVDSVPQGVLDLEIATPDVLSNSESSESQRKSAWNGLMMYLYGFIKFAPDEV